MQSSKLKIDESEFLLRYDFNNLADAESVADCNLLAALEDMGNTTGSQLRGLLFAMTRTHHPDLGLKQVGALIRMDTIGPIMKAMGDACAVAVSEEYAEKYRAAMSPDAERSEGLPAVVAAG